MSRTHLESPRDHSAAAGWPRLRWLESAGGGASSILVVGFAHLGDAAWDVLAEEAIGLVRVADAAAAVGALTEHPVEVVVADAGEAPALIDAVRARRDLSAVHVIVGVPLDSPSGLRTAIDAGADDVIRVPFEPEVLVARVGAGLDAARLRAGETLLRSLIGNLPGAVYRGACDEHWTMQWISDEIEAISGYPAEDFIESAARTFASVIHPDDRELVVRSVADAADGRRPFTIEYRIMHRDGSVRWVLERGQVQRADDGRSWLDGVIFDITVRRRAEKALHEREIAEAQLAEVHASRARILESADRARRQIERNLHDGAQQRFVVVAMRLQAWLRAHGDLAPEARGQLEEVMDELRAGLAELRDLARGLHPAVLTDRGLEHALSVLAARASVPVEVGVSLEQERLPMPIEAAAYFTICEALTNVERYARASRAWVTLEGRNGHLYVEVGDDGVGGAAFGTGSGLQGLRDRVEAVEGVLDVTARPGGGTVLRARLPVARDG